MADKAAELLITLFLALPVSWKGTLAQYAGRKHREHEGKDEVVVYDYVDTSIPVLSRMKQSREKGYAALGYVLDSINFTLSTDIPNFQPSK